MDDIEKAQQHLQQLVAQASEILKVAQDVAIQHQIELNFMGQTFNLEENAWLPLVSVDPSWENSDEDWIDSGCVGNDY